MHTEVVSARGLPIACTVWGDPTLPGVLLLHGLLDHGRSWRGVAERLAARFHLVAPDFRGHGRSGWVGPGGYYHFHDYILDTALVVDASFVAEERITVVGHSMGASVASAFAAAFPARVGRLALIDSLGLLGDAPSEGPRRIARWIREVRAADAAEVRELPDVAAAADRLRHVNPRISADFALEIAEYGTRPGPTGGRIWASDPLHRTRSPRLYRLDEAQAMWSALPPGVLVVLGAESPFIPPDRDERLAALPSPRLEILPEVGHNVHHEAPEALAALLGDWIADAAG
jgi:pimeloyl-ACP methyl ester carboxylesterase